MLFEPVKIIAPEMIGRACLLTTFLIMFGMMTLNLFMFLPEEGPVRWVGSLTSQIPRSGVRPRARYYTTSGIDCNDVSPFLLLSFLLMRPSRYPRRHRQMKRPYHDERRHHEGTLFQLQRSPRFHFSLSSTSWLGLSMISLVSIFCEVKCPSGSANSQGEGSEGGTRIG